MTQISNTKVASFWCTQKNLRAGYQSNMKAIGLMVDFKPPPCIRSGIL